MLSLRPRPRTSIENHNPSLLPQRSKSRTRKTPAAPGDRGFRSSEPRFGSVFADVDGAQAIAVGGRHPACDIASVVTIATTDEADAEAVMEMMVMETPSAAAPSTAPRSRGSGGGSQRDGAEC